MKQQDTMKELSRLSGKELQKNLADKREKLRLLRFDLTAGKIKNVREIRGAKKDIARIFTLLNKK